MRPPRGVAALHPIFPEAATSSGILLLPHSSLDYTQAAPLPSTDAGTLGKHDDGYRAARPTPDSLALLREQLLALLQGARFWDKSCDWMQVHLGPDFGHMPYRLSLVVLG